MQNVLRLKYKAANKAAEEAVKFMASVGDAWMIRVDVDGYYRMLRVGSTPAFIASKYPVRLIGPCNGRASTTDLADDMREMRQPAPVKVQERQPRKPRADVTGRKERLASLADQTLKLVAQQPMTTEQICQAIAQTSSYTSGLVRYMVKDGSLVRVKSICAGRSGGVKYAYGPAEMKAAA